MRFIKARKPRGLKLNGRKSYDMCTGCYMPFCNSMAASPLYYEKIRRRLKEGNCPACGHNPCRCKSKLGISSHLMITHNNKKRNG